MLDSFLKGMMTPIRAVGVIFSSPKLIGWSALPIVATIVVLSVVFYALMAGLWTVIHTHFTGFFANYQTTLMTVTGVLAGAVFIYASTYTLSFLISLVASPFNDFLAESTERVLGVQNVPGFSLGRAIRVFFLDLRKTVLTVSAGLILSLVLLIPIAGLIAVPALALLNAFTFVTYPQSRREHGVHESLRWIRSHLPVSLGFGFTATILFAVPVINFFALPVLVVAGTMLYLEADKQQSPTLS